MAGIRAGTAQHWFQPTTATSDHFHSCGPLAVSNVSTPANVMGFQHPRTGKAYAGLTTHTIPYSGTGYSEYLSTRLQETLDSGQLYIGSFWVSQSDFIRGFSVSQLGMHFSKRIPRSVAGVTTRLPWHPQIESDSTFIFNDTTNWVEVKDTFQARGYEQYITLGRFGLGPVIRNYFSSGSYYFIDDVGVYRYDPIVNDTICFGDSIQIDNEWVKSAGIYLDTLLGYPVRHSVEVISPRSGELDTTICMGDILWINGRSYSTTGIYTDTLMSTEGCDSLLTIRLSVLSNSSTTIDTALCFGDTIKVGTKVLRSSGIYHDTLVNHNGCDSVVTTTLSFLSTSGLVIDISVCNGDSIITGGTTKSSAGTFYDTLVNHLGCDSVVQTNLTILNHSFSPDRHVGLCGRFGVDG